MAKKKQKKLVITYPKEMTRELGSTTLFLNGSEEKDGFFFQNPNVGKRPKNYKDQINFVNESRVEWAIVNNNTAHVTLDATVAELERFVKAVKKRQAYWKKCNAERKKRKLPEISSWFLHFNPELSFFFSK